MPSIPNRAHRPYTDHLAALAFLVRTFYRQVHAQGDQALVITVTAKHSGTYQSALLAKAMVPQASVKVFDSASISLGTGWMVVERRAQRAGATARQHPRAA